MQLIDDDSLNANIYWVQFIEILNCLQFTKQAYNSQSDTISFRIMLKMDSPQLMYGFSSRLNKFNK